MNKFVHIPVLSEEVVQAIQPVADGRYADGTIGGGGHAELILTAGSPGARLYGSDRDGAAVEAASSRLARFEHRLEIRRGEFETLAEWVESGSLDGVLLDLGVSSPQLDMPERGFSVVEDGPLDMRMDRRKSLTAEELVNGLNADELATMFWENGGERESRKIARAIVSERELNRFSRTGQLADFIERIKPRRGKKTHPATKVFQALRIEVNDEYGAIRRGLPLMRDLLKPGGRLAVITFHSGEDRMVKEFGRVESREYDLPGVDDVPALRIPRQARMRWVSRKAIRAGDEEVARNPRARSAQLRVLEKQGHKEKR